MTPKFHFIVIRAYEIEASIIRNNHSTREMTRRNKDLFLRMADNNSSIIKLFYETILFKNIQPGR